MSVSVSDIVVIAVIAVVIYFFFLKDNTKAADTSAVCSSAKDAASLEKDADLKVYTREELRQFDGKKTDKVYIGIAGKVFDATGAADYAVGGEFEIYAGRDISRAVAKFSVDEKNLENYSITDLNLVERDKMRHMFNTFYTKYPLIGKLASENKKSD